MDASIKFLLLLFLENAAVGWPTRWMVDEIDDMRSTGSRGQPQQPPPSQEREAAAAAADAGTGGQSCPDGYSVSQTPPTSTVPLLYHYLSRQ